MPAASVTRPLDAARARDRAALAALAERGEEFTAEAFAEELARLMREEPSVLARPGR